MQFSSIWPIDRAQSGTTTSRHNGPESDGNKGVRQIPQSTSITEKLPPVCLVSYQDTRWAFSPPYRDVDGIFYSPGRLFNFPISICPKVNLNPRRDFEHAYDDVVVRYASH